LLSKIRALVERQWVITLNFAQRSVNLTAAVLVTPYKDQKDEKMLLVVPPTRLQTALNLDEETFHFAQKFTEGY